MTLRVAFVLMVGLGCNGAISGGNGGPNEGPDSGSPQSGRDSGFDVARGPCTITRTREDGSVDQVFEYNGDGREISLTQRGTTYLIEWAGDVSTYTNPSSGFATRRNYRETKHGLRIEKIETDANQVTWFDGDAEGNISSAQIIRSDGSTGAARTYESSGGWIKSEILHFPSFDTRRSYYYDDGKISRLEWDERDDGSVEKRTMLLRDSGLLIERREETMDEEGVITSTTRYTYSSQGECDFVDERWYMRGYPSIEL